MPVRVLNHEEEIVAGSVTSGSPPDLDVLAREVIGPIANVVPAGRLEGVVVGVFRKLEKPKGDLFAP